jgi:hypothetical protein
VVLNKNTYFEKIGNRKVKQVLFGGWDQWEGGEYMERVKKAECSRNITYLCLKMEK